MPKSNGAPGGGGCAERRHEAAAYQRELRAYFASREFFGAVADARESASGDTPPLWQARRRALFLPRLSSGFPMPVQWAGWCAADATGRPVV